MYCVIKNYIIPVLFLNLSLALISISVFAVDLIRSSSLHIIKSEDGNTERTDYVDDDGNITYAADKHYATLIKTKSGNTMLEEYFDATGKPALQNLGHFALLHEYDTDGQDVKITYLGADHKPVMIRSGYAIAVRIFNSSGLVQTELYYDTEGLATETPMMAYGCLKEYNESGRNIKITYLNRDHEPAMSGQGFAIMRRSYYETDDLVGLVKDEFYYNENDQPIKLSLGQYGILKEYDEYGRVISITYLDADGNSIINYDGFTTLKRTYNEDDSIKTELYYDIKGNPIALSEGQYGYRYENGSTAYIDSKGNDLFNLRIFLHSHSIGVILICIFVVILSLVINRNMNIGLLFLYIIFIIYMTLLCRNVGAPNYNLTLFWSYKQFFINDGLRWEIIYNIILFIPLGSILYQLFPRYRALLFVFIMSVLVEIIQLFSGIGLCELDDLISNGLGGIVGFSVANIVNLIGERKKLDT